MASYSPIGTRASQSQRKNDDNNNKENNEDIDEIFPIDKSGKTARTPIRNQIQDEKLDKSTTPPPGSQESYNKEELKGWNQAGMKVKEMETQNLDKVWQNKDTVQNNDKCGSCDKLFKSIDENCIGCDYCELWFHAACVGIKKNELKFIGKSENIPWFCKKCRDQQIMLYKKCQKLEKENELLKTKDKEIKEEENKLDGKMEIMKNEIIREMTDKVVDGLKNIITEGKFQTNIKKEIVNEAKLEIKELIDEAKNTNVNQEMRKLVAEEIKPLIRKQCELTNDIKSIVAEEMRENFEKMRNTEIDNQKEIIKQQIDEVMTDSKKEMLEMVVESRKEMKIEIRQVVHEEMQGVKSKNNRNNDNVTNSESRQRYEQELMEKIDSLSKKQEEFASSIPNANLKQEVINIIKNEEIDKQRKMNIIMYNIPESKKDIGKLREEDDKINMDKIIKEGIKIQNIETTKIFRLGKSKVGEGSHESSANPRPLLIQLKKEKDKWDILKNAKNLKDAEGWMKRVGISTDMNKEERKQNADLRAELKAKKDEGDNSWQIKKGKLQKRDI